MSKGKLLSINKPLEQKIFLLLCSGVALTVPFKASWNSLMCILLVLFWALFQDKKIDGKRIRWVLLLSPVFFLALLGLLYSSNIDEALFRLQQKSVLFLFPLVFCSIEIDFEELVKDVLSIFILGLVAACAFSLFASLLAWIRTGYSSFFFGHDLAEWLNIYPYVLALICLVAIILLFERLKHRLKMQVWLSRPSVCITLIIFFTLFIFSLSVKQVIISWFLIVIFYSFQFVKRTLHIVITLSVVSIVLCILIVVIPTLREKAYQVINAEKNVIPLDTDASLGKTWDGISLRRAIWTCSIDVVRGNFWIGVGTGDAHDELQKAYENRKFYFASRYNRYNAHNQYIQTMVNFGIIGFSIFVTCIAMQLFILRNHPLFIAFTICVMSSFLTESMLETNKGILVYGFFGSLIFFWKIRSQPQHYPLK